MLWLFGWARAMKRERLTAFLAAATVVVAVAAVAAADATVETVCASFDGKSVTTPPACPPPYRHRHALVPLRPATAGNDADPLLVLYGGFSRCTEPLYPRSDVWLLHGTADAARWTEQVGDWREAAGASWAAVPAATYGTDAAQPMPRGAHTMLALAGDALLVAGGVTYPRAESFETPLRDVWLLNVSSGAWRVLVRDTGLPERTVYAVETTTTTAGAGPNTTLYAFGGLRRDETGAGADTYSSDIYAVDVGDPGATATVVPPQGAARPPPRAEHTGVYRASARQLVVFGGTNGQTALGDLWLLDLASMTWTERVARGLYAPSSRYSHAAALCVGDAAAGRADLLVVLGGRNRNNYLSDMWVYNFSAPEDDAWVFVTSLGALTASAVACVDGVAYVSSGMVASGDAVANHLLRIDLAHLPPMRP